MRRALQAAGYRFGLSGSPDIVFPARRAAVFVHGCFWHRHLGCRAASTPKTRADFWSAKFAANIERDQRVAGALQRQGWSVHVVWECGTSPRQLPSRPTSIPRESRRLSAACTARRQGTWTPFVRAASVVT